MTNIMDTLLVNPGHVDLILDNRHSECESLNDVKIVCMDGVVNWNSVLIAIWSPVVRWVMLGTVVTNS